MAYPVTTSAVWGEWTLAVLPCASREVVDRKIFTIAKQVIEDSQPQLQKESHQARRVSGHFHRLDM